MASDSLTVTAEFVDGLGQIGRYQVTATLTVTVESLSQAVEAVADALGDLA